MRFWTRNCIAIIMQSHTYSVLWQHDAIIYCKSDLKQSIVNYVTRITPIVLLSPRVCYSGKFNGESSREDRARPISEPDTTFSSSLFSPGLKKRSSKICYLSQYIRAQKDFSGFILDSRTPYVLISNSKMHFREFPFKIRTG